MRQHLAWSAFGPNFDIHGIHGVEGDGGKNKDGKESPLIMNTMIILPHASPIPIPYEVEEVEKA
jgi:hypothetical protein